MPSKSIWHIKPYTETMAAFDRAAKLRGYGMLSVVYAVGGSGKTFCAEMYAEKHPEHVLITVPPRILIERGRRAFLDCLAGPLGLEVSCNTPAMALTERIAQSLKRRGGMLMLDEADQLTSRLTDLVRRISMDAGCPVCYIGTPTLLQTLRLRGPVSSRIGFRFGIQPAQVGDLQEMFPATFPAAAYEEIIAVTGGNLRMIGNLWEQLRDVKRALGYEAITPAAVRTTAQEFLLAVA